MIWLALLIPVVTAIVLLVFFSHKTVWWEFLIPFGLSIFLIGMFKLGAEISQTTDTEFWTGWGYEARYYEDWNEYIHRTCTREVCSGTGERRSCHTEFYDCSYVDYHPEYWIVHESNGQKLRITESKFNELSKRWNNKSFVDLRRNYHTNDGDMYVSKWDQSLSTMEVLTTAHSYENRVAATNNVFTFPEVEEETKKRYGIWNYPPIYRDWKQPSLLGVDSSHEASVALNKLNARLGREKQVKFFILLFHNKPLEASLVQEDAWKGGNKNELVLTIGIDTEWKVQWARAFSWSDREAAEVYVKEVALKQQNQRLDLLKIVNESYPIIEKHFVRKHFEDFSYISVQPTTFQIILTFVLTLLANIGISFFIVKNEFQEGRVKSRYRFTNSRGPR